MSDIGSHSCNFIVAAGALLLMNNIKTNRLFFVLIALIFMAYGALSFIGPQDLIQWLIQSYGLDDEKAKLLPVHIQETTWLKLKITLAIILFFLCYLFYYDKYFIKEYRLSFSSFVHWIKKDLLAFSSKERIILITLVTLFAVVLAFYSSITPMQLDELHTWLFFIKRGPLVTAAYYPASNNHIAYNLLSIPWSIFLSPIWALRMVSLLSAVGTVILFMLILKRRYGFIWSVAGMLLLMSSACFAWYAVQGRGYVLELFSLMTILYVVIQSPLDFAADRLLIIGNAFAVYCVPVAIIPLVLLNGFYAYQVFKVDRSNLKRIVKTAAYSIALIFLCYLPVGIFSGFEQLINNPFVQRISYQDAFFVGCTVYLPAIWNFISGCEGPVALCLLMVLLGGTIMCLKNSRFVLLTFLLLVFPLFLLQCYPVLLFERTWLWLIIPFIGWCIEIIYTLTRKGEIYKTMIAIAFIITIMTVNTLRSYSSNQLLVNNAQHFLTLKQAIEIHLNGKAVCVYDDVLYDYLFFYQGENKKYALIYGAPETVVEADAVVKDLKHFNPSDGKILWADSVNVLFITK